MPVLEIQSDAMRRGGERELYDDPLAIIECPATVENIEQLANNLDLWFESKEFYPAVLVGISINKNIVVERGALLVHDIVDAISAMQPYRDLVHDWE